MVGCTLLILSINDFNLFLPCSHRKNLSTMYLHHKYVLHTDSFNNSSSSSSINKILYGGAKLLPITEHRFCLNVFFPNVNMVFFKTISAKSKIVLLELYFSFQLLSRFLNLDRPSPCHMFGYNTKPSIVHKTVYKDNFGGVRIYSRNKILPFDLVAVNDGQK